MAPNERKPTGILYSAQKLRQLVVDNPDLPLLVFAGEDANNGDYGYVTCSHVHAYIGEFLDCCQIINNKKCYTDRDEFKEDMEIFYANFDGSDSEFDTFIKKEIAEYTPYWKKCIILSVDN